MGNMMLDFSIKFPCNGPLAEQEASTEAGIHPQLSLSSVCTGQKLWGSPLCVTLRSSSLCNHSCDRGQRRCWITCRNNSRDRELWTRGHWTDMTASLRSPDIRFPSYWLYSLSGLSHMWKSRQACSADPALGVLANVTRFVKLFLNTFEAWSKT